MYFTTHFIAMGRDTIDEHLNQTAKEKGATLVQTFRSVDADGDRFYECLWFVPEYSYWDQFMKCGCGLHR